LAPPASGTAAATSPLPTDLWRGVDAPSLERLLAATPLPSPSPALATLIARALAAGDQVNGADLALRVSALERSGRVVEAAELLARAAETNEPSVLGRYALALLALGREDDACEVHIGETLGGASADKSGRETLLVPVYCAAAKGDLPGAKLALQLARDGGAEVGLAAAAIGSLSKTPTQRSPLPKSVGVIDYTLRALKRVGLDAEARRLGFEALYAHWPSRGKA
jgi:hypothetical protein